MHDTRLVGWSLTSLFSTNTAISKTSNMTHKKKTNKRQRETVEKIDWQHH